MDNILKESLVKNKEIETLEKENVRCITGDRDYLYPKLKQAIEKAVSVDIIVAFLMESGVRMLEKEFILIKNKKIPIRILTGNYLNITQPSALYLLKDIMGNSVDIRFYDNKSRSFHPKAYIFNYKNNNGEIFIGSSNMSKSALINGIEWNYRISKKRNEEDFEYYEKIFENLFFNKSIIVTDEELKNYSSVWKSNKIVQNLYKDENKDNIKSKENDVIKLYKPREAQIEALYELKKSRNEGMDKGLVVAATGIGKTYIAAFDSINFKRVLFVAHREEILKQAQRSFGNVRHDAVMGFFIGNQRNAHCDILFATVQTLGKIEYLKEQYFSRDYFDYIVIDEFHHAVSKNYQNIINYFKPKFLLGLTATPERLDNKDVFAICDYNVVYEVGLKDAINKGWLVPFRYYGIFDKTDYDKVEYKNGKYNEKELESILMINKRKELVINNYKKFKSERALAFCSSKNHAEYMAKYFCKNNIKACAVYSGCEGEYSLERNEAISKLRNGEINVIFSIDMFNEGLDIPNIDLVMFLRPTESPTIFFQQLGRGLRKYNNKNYLNVLDFIGNYKKALMVPFLLTGNNKIIKERNKTKVLPNEDEYPQDCIVDFEWQVIDVFKRQAQENKNVKSIIVEEYYRIKEILNKKPTRVDMLTYMDDGIYKNMKKRSKFNIFRNYLKFLQEINEISEEEKRFQNTFASEFINMIECTPMTKTYKMPLIFTFYNNGNMKLKINKDDIYLSFKRFYSNGSNKVDMMRHKNTADFEKWGKEQYIKLAEDNPIKFLLKTESKFFYKCGEEFCISDELKPYIENKSFLYNFEDAVKFRVREYLKNRIHK